MQEIILRLIEQYGYFGVALLIAVENLFPPIPSEVILTFSGFMTTYTNLNVWLVIIFATIGADIGAIILYYIFFNNFFKIYIRSLDHYKMGKFRGELILVGNS